MRRTRNRRTRPGFRRPKRLVSRRAEPIRLYAVAGLRARCAQMRGRVVLEDKIPWPTRGPNVGQRRLAQPCGSGSAPGRKMPANDDVLRRSSPRVVVPDSACHAGGRGFESRRSRPPKSLQISQLCCRSGRGRSICGPIRGPNVWRKMPAKWLFHGRACSPAARTKSSHEPLCCSYRRQRARHRTPSSPCMTAS
jgi:hypothetical protein